MIEECVIVGGGVAGLSAANQLVDKGLKPLIIDAGTYPSHRICGEYFSHECLPILHRWGIALSGQIREVSFIVGPHAIHFALPIYAGSASRYEFDIQLLERAKKRGAKVLTETTAQILDRSENYTLKLSSGETIQARHLIIGAGKMHTLDQTPAPTYYGFKAHFGGIDIENRLEMHCFDGGYFGMSTIDSETTNVACIALKSAAQGPPEQFMQRFPKARMLYPKWLMAQVPEFGIRKTPNWERVFWIGDAAGSIPPMSGEGLAIAVTSGCMAADYLLNSNAEAFKKDWLKRYKSRFFWAKQMHRLMLTRWTANMACAACKLIPQLPLYLWKLTREK